MKKIICKDYEEMSRVGAVIVAQHVIKDPKCVLGLATGGTPVGMYSNLVDMHKLGDLDFSRVVSFNLDEYYPIKKSNDQSYDYFMWDNLFSHINVNPYNVHLPNGETDNPETECVQYEKKISEAGGIDIQVLGVGVNGHIGFNEPGDELSLVTHLTKLTPSTIEVNSRYFEKVEDVPTEAITMGMGTIMNAKSILLLISGESKAEVVKTLMSDTVTTATPVSFLKMHSDVTIVLDKAAASLL